jgi:hypothetical protein
VCPSQPTNGLEKHTPDFGILPYLLDQLNESVGAEYEEIDDVFGFSEFDAGGTAEAVADGGTVTQQGPAENVQTSHVETLYHEILKETHVLDPAVGSGAFLLAAQEVLMDLYISVLSTSNCSPPTANPAN